MSDELKARRERAARREFEGPFYFHVRSGEESFCVGPMPFAVARRLCLALVPRTAGGFVGALPAASVAELGIEVAPGWEPKGGAE